MQKIEVWVVIDENGDLETGSTRDEAFERFNDNIGSTDVAIKVLMVEVEASLPKPILIKGEVLEEAEPVEA